MHGGPHIWKQAVLEGIAPTHTGIDATLWKFFKIYTSIGAFYTYKK